MEPRIVIIPTKKIAGLKRRASMKTNNSVINELWPNFMKSKHLIPNQISSGLFSIQIFNTDFLNADTEFEKWAAVEIEDFLSIPDNFDILEMQGGLYAVFIHRGVASMKTHNFIFNNWLPNSEYTLDRREQFEIMPVDFSPDDPEAIEEIWVPVIKKQ